MKRFGIEPFGVVPENQQDKKKDAIWFFNFATMKITIHSVLKNEIEWKRHFRFNLLEIL